MYGNGQQGRKGGHTIVSGHHAVDTKSGVLLLNLAGLYRRKRFDRTQTGVLGKRHRHGIQCVGERAHGVLFNSRALWEIVSDSKFMV